MIWDVDEGLTRFSKIPAAYANNPKLGKVRWEADVEPVRVRKVGRLLLKLINGEITWGPDTYAFYLEDPHWTSLD